MKNFSNTLKKLLVFCCLFFSYNSIAETSEIVKKITWQDVVVLTQKSNPDLKSAESAWKALQMTESSVHSGFFPQITGSLSYTQGNNSSAFATTDTTTTYSASISATQNIFSGFQDEAKIEQAKANAKASEAAYHIAKAKISYDLKSAYAGYVFSQNNVLLLKDILHRRESNLRLVDLRFESGRENKGSLLLSQAYLEQGKFELLQAQNALQTAVVQLSQVVGSDLDSQTLQGSELPVIAPQKIDQLQSLVVNTPEFIQFSFQEIAARASLKLTEAAFFPTLALTGTTGNFGPDWYPQTNRWSVGATLSFPFFTGGKDYYSRKSSLESLKVATFNLESQKQQILVKLQQKYTTYLESLQKLNVDQAFLQALSTQERIAKEKYNNGLLTFEEWDKIENDLISRQKVILQSEKDRIVNEAAWEQAQGKGVF